MKLHVHHLSHPLIQNLYNITSELITPNNIIVQANKHLGLFMIYETVRKLVKVYHLSIKQIKSSKEIVLIDPKDSYTIVFNDLKCLSMFQEMQLLLPKINLELIQNHDIESIVRIDSILDGLSPHSKIIIVNYNINIQYIESIINLFTKKNTVKTHKISIICIKCTTAQLLQLSENKLYKDLTIYTAKIIQN